MTLLAQAGSNAALLTFLAYTAVVFVLAGLANRLLKGRDFLSEYFLGSRGLGVWAFALTFAATSASGGSFTGFPSKIYSHGWVLALWIGSYMVVPIFTMGLLGKRLNQVARLSGAITVPDVIRDRFRSRWFGLLATLLIVFFTSFNLVAQFKAGREILRTLLQDVSAFQSSSAWLGEQVSDIGFFAGVEPEYLLCLLAFGIAVIVYTTYGGFHAVVWTDVMQGVVMVAGVLILLPLSISAVGGLEKGTRDLAKMTPPRLVYLDLELDDNFGVQKGDWIRSHDQAGNPQVFRIAETRSIDSDRPKENKQTIAMVDAIQITSPHEVERILRDEKLFKNGVRITRLPPSNSLRGSGQLNLSSEYYQGVAAGTAFWLPRESVLAKFRLVDPWQPTAYGAYSVQPMRFEVSTPRDEPLPSQDELRNAFRTLSGRKAAVEMSAIQFASTGGPDNPGVYVTGPGPSYSSSSGFLPFSLAISFFFMWCMGGAGQPNFMVRLMAFNNSKTLRNGIVTVTIYYSLIYFPLVIIFCCARVLLPGMEIESDRIMPAMALHLTERAGMAWLAGLLIAAPFAAVMSTVDSFLLVISSSVVRDIYQRNINPDASEKTMKRIAYGCTLVVGIIAMLGAVNPPQFLQDIIVYVGSGLAACFLAPMVFGLYWPRINSAGAIAAMLGGFGTHIAMYLLGMFLNGSFFNPFKIFGFDPTVVGLIGSFACGYVVTKMTAEPPEDLVQKYFCKPVAND